MPRERDINCPYKCTPKGIFSYETKNYKPCPHCSNLERIMETREDGGSSLLEGLKIPPEYHNSSTVDREILQAPNITNMFSSSSIKEVGEILHRINDALFSGKVLGLSTYIHVPNIIDIKKYVYGAQKLALEKNLSVVPYLSLNALYGVQRSADYPELSGMALGDDQYRSMGADKQTAYDGIRLSNEIGLTYFDFKTSDVCFVEASASTLRKGWSLLADLLGERSKRGLPTYVIGYWSTKASTDQALRYLIAERGMQRLDLLTPFELLSQRGEGNRGQQAQNMGVATQANINMASEARMMSPTSTGGVSLGGALGR